MRRVRVSGNRRWVSSFCTGRFANQTIHYLFSPLHARFVSGLHVAHHGNYTTQTVVFALRTYSVVALEKLKDLFDELFFVCWSQPMFIPPREVPLVLGVA